jgi:hypothetical protein
VEIKEAKEIIKAGLAWASWTEEQREAMKVALIAMIDVESIKDFCINCDGDERKIQPYEILDLLK